MIDKSKLKEDSSYIYTNCTALAAALVALGFQFKKVASYIRTFTQSHPPGTLGKFFFRLEPFSPLWHVTDANRIRAEWFQRKADQELDDLRNLIAERLSAGVMAACKNPADAKPYLEEIQQRFVRFQEILPAAIMSYMAQAEENRQDILDKMVEVAKSGKDCPMRKYDTGGDTFTWVPNDVSEEILDKMLRRIKRKR